MNTTITLNPDDTITRDGVVYVKQSVELVAELGSVWQPKANERYWFVRTDGTAGDTIWNDSYGGDEKRHESGNCYQTKPEAEARAKRDALIERAYRVRNDIWKKHGTPNRHDIGYHPIGVDDLIGHRIAALNDQWIINPWRFVEKAHCELFTDAMGDLNVRHLLRLLA